MHKLLIAASLAALAVPCVAMAQPGYFDSYGVWHRDYGVDAAYAGMDTFAAREGAIGRRIDDARADGMISGSQARFDRNRLAGIRDTQADMVADNGFLTGSDRARLTARLDDLDAIVNAQSGD